MNKRQIKSYMDGTKEKHIQNEKRKRSTKHKRWNEKQKL